MDIRLIYYDFKNLKTYFYVPIFIIYLFIPVLSIGMVKMYGVENSKIMIFKEVEKFIPIISMWWTTFIFREYIEGDGNELLYCINKTGKIKSFQIFIIFLCYVLHVGILFLVGNIFWDNILFEFIKTVVQCFFFTSAIYVLIYTLKSTTISFMILLIYALFSLFINSKISQVISIFGNGDILIMNIISTKSLKILFVSTILFIIGVYKNKVFY
ncbi:ABC transporter permease [Sedimentibacter hydroxybenzoicus DSM 7310]|uniref:ABC transporter permease n=1 Tax=Sedimentibacter hydroxybenzoicus DSM 7310 TaxID=1123245 RepID=A0A974GXF4_SEDHY|nr:ABC transporter permease [Sedimentibacter hydroxybenzoicus]NYB75549.1 ABC transporter permease [Sedimentibacter hydroxybenzoicus DSM 7310]